MLQAMRERESMISACITASWTHYRPSSSGSSVVAGWNTRPLLSPRSCSILRAATAASFNGTYVLFFLRPRDVFHLAFLVYHAPPRSVMTALRMPALLASSNSTRYKGHFTSILFRSLFPSLRRSQTRLFPLLRCAPERVAFVDVLRAQTADFL